MSHSSSLTVLLFRNTRPVVRITHRFTSCLFGAVSLDARQPFRRHNHGTGRMPEYIQKRSVSTSILRKAPLEQNRAEDGTKQHVGNGLILALDLELGRDHKINITTRGSRPNNTCYYNLYEKIVLVRRILNVLPLRRMGIGEQHYL
jgi:hypothetical protein